MEKDFRHIDDLTVLYLSGQASAEDAAGLRRMLEESEELRRRYRAMREVWFSTASREAAPEFDTEAAWELFKGRVDESHSKRSRRKIYLRFIRYAAVVAVLVAVGLFAYRRGGDSVTDRFANITIEAPLGSRTNFRLPDGSSVWLNAGSTITYSQGFGVVSRDVSISGEGYFDVAHDESLPFVVESGSIRVTVLGTEFNFCDYPDDIEASVSLTRGKVELVSRCGDDYTTVLSPGESVEIDKATGRARKMTLDNTGYSQWTKGNLFFDEAPLEDIARRLERSYCVNITIAGDSLARQRFYGSFMRNTERIEDVLDALASTQGISYTIEGRDITLR